MSVTFTRHEYDYEQLTTTLVIETETAKQLLEELAVINSIHDEDKTSSAITYNIYSGEGVPLDKLAKRVSEEIQAVQAQGGCCRG